MSKKRFTTGLDDLFSNTNDALDVGLEAAAARQHDRRAPHKNFIADLDSLLQEALQESLEKYEQAQGQQSGKKATPAGAMQPMLHGLDALIRQTIDVQAESNDDAGLRRITVAVDKTKLEQLKMIARLEKSYLKDLLVGLIDEFIEKYRQRKGIDL